MRRDSRECSGRQKRQAKKVGTKVEGKLHTLVAMLLRVGSGCSPLKKLRGKVDGKGKFVLSWMLATVGSEGGHLSKG